MLGAKAGELMGPREWLGVPMCGGMAELRHFKARTMLVSDLHRAIINLARVAKHKRAELQEACGLLFHPDNLALAQARCRAHEECGYVTDYAIASEHADYGILQWAADYFVCCWMARSSTAGTANEFNASLATRWEAGGGDSAKRYRGAIDMLAEFERIAHFCTFVCQDVFDFLAEAQKRDRPTHGIYIDPTFPGTGDKYKFCLTPEQHERLAKGLIVFRETRIVMRFYDHPDVRGLYPERLGWTWHRLSGGRDQANNADTPELLLTLN
jgi:DNA adenine methylase